MNNITDFMFDFETMDKRPTSVVLSLAFIPFKRNELLSFKEYVNNAYYWKFELNHQVVDYNRTTSKDTLEWWDKQDPEVKRSQFSPTPDDVTLKKMLIELNKSRKDHDISNKSIGYCRGQSFDFPILQDIVETVKPEIDEFPLNSAFFPCAFWNQMDVRSYIRGLINDVTNDKVPLPNGTLSGFRHHNPIDDCARAILHVKYAEGYSSGEIEVPDDVEPLSYK